MVQLETIEGVDLLKALQAKFKPILSRRGGVVLGLWGDPGIGKSHTARTVLAGLGCRGFSLHSTASLGQWLQALPEVDTLPLWAERVLKRLGQGEHVSPEAAADALSKLLEALAPVVLHLEDLHEAGEERSSLITLLAHKVMATKGVGLLITSRSQPPQPFVVERLEPLELAATEQLLARELGVAVPREASRWIFERSRGNPLFTLEHLRYLARGGYLWSDGKRWNWRTPPPGLLPVTVEALIERLIAEVQDLTGAAEVLQARAILPQQVKQEVWAKVAGLSEGGFEQARRELDQRNLLRGEQFAHPLFREVTERNLSPQRRQELARRALEALQDDAVAAAAFVQMAQLEPTTAQQILGRAVEQSRQRQNPVQAARFLGQMVLYAQGPEKAQVALTAAQALKTIDVVEATRLAKIAEGSQVCQSQAVYLQAELEAIQGRIKEAERLLMVLRGEGDYWTRLLKLRGSAMDYSGVLEILDTHPEVLDQPDAETAHRAARAYAQNGQIAQAERIVSKALAQPDLSQADQALLLRASSQIALMKSDYAEAERLEAQIQILAREMGNLRLLDQALFNRALALEGLGRYRECLGQLGTAQEVCLELGDRTAYVIAQVAHARHLFEFAEYERAEGLLLEARDHLSQLDPSVYLLDCQTSLSTLYREWQPSHGPLLALKHARAALEAAQQIKNPRNMVAALHCLSLAEANLHPEEALRLAQQAQQAADSLNLEEAQFLALQARACALEALGQTDEALQFYRQAHQLSPSAGSLLETHKLGLKISQLSGNLQQAAEHLRWLEERGLQHAVVQALRWMPEGIAGEQRGRGAGEQQSRSFSPLHPSEAMPPSAKRGAPLPSVPLTRLEALGPMRFSHNGHNQPVRGPKRQELLALLLEARLTGRSEVGRLELLDLLYPGVEEAQAASALKSTVHVIRASFGQNIIQTSPQGYALGSIASDVEAFLQDGDTHLWRGVYLEGVGCERSETVQFQLQERLKAMLEQILDLAERMRLAKLLVGMDPYDLASWRTLLEALRLSENHRSLSRSYAECRERLNEVGEHLPERWQDFLEPGPTRSRS